MQNAERPHHCESRVGVREDPPQVDGGRSNGVGFTTGRGGGEEVTSDQPINIVNYQTMTYQFSSGGLVHQVVP